ncbi:hypothetical protein [Moorena sp. SIO3I8]|uniref:hypothetical protein n=1 Tax=Moorena sp. SIO3I8 TaxID=2607833 RepID=UPI0025DCCB87|nr:hypothetical protein [Moorena sp. SIO3I8]
MLICDHTSDTSRAHSPRPRPTLFPVPYSLFPVPCSLIMTFILNSHNVFDYLAARGLCNPSEQALSKIEPLEAKNFNLLLTFPDGNKLLVKQERHNQEGKAAGEFLNEWRIQEFLQKFPELA